MHPPPPPPPPLLCGCILCVRTGECHVVLLTHVHAHVLAQVLERYRLKRLAEMKAAAAKDCFGAVINITGDLHHEVLLLVRTIQRRTAQTSVCVFSHERPVLLSSLPRVACLCTGARVFTGNEYVKQINEAGKGIWVVVFLYRTE